MDRARRTPCPESGPGRAMPRICRVKSLRCGSRSGICQFAPPTAISDWIAAQVLILTPWRKTLIAALSEARQEVVIVSPFIKTAIAANVVAALDRRGISVRTLTRFKTDDFGCGVSDIDAAWMLSNYTNGRLGEFDLRVDNKLHAKIYLIDRIVAFIGSSNLTFSGLMRNYEAGVRTTDPAVLTQLNEEIGDYWLRCVRPTESDFSEMLAELRHRGRRVAVEEEHAYETDSEIRLFISPDDNSPDPDWLDTDGVSAPIERITSFPEATQSSAAAAAAKEFGASDTHLAQDTQSTENVARQQVEAIDQQVGEFLDKVENMGIPARRNRLLYSVSIRHPSLCFAADKHQYLAVHCSHLDPETFFTTEDDGIPMGQSVFSIACFTIAARSGILRLFGRVGMSMMIAAAKRGRLLDTLWQQNFLGPLLLARGAEAGKMGIADAAYRLFRAVAQTEGLATSTRFIERYFNPIDILGSDMASVLAFKDPKTTLQEIAQANGLHPIYGGHTNAGSAHQTAWRCEVRVGKAIHAAGDGVSKIDAEMDAATKAVTMASRHPAHARTVVELRRAGLAKARVERFLLPHHQLDSAQKRQIQSAYKTVLNVSVDPYLGYSALIDSETMALRKLPGNNQVLTTLGSELIAYGRFRRAVQLGKPIPKMSLTLQMTDEIIRTFRIIPLRVAAGFSEPISRGPLVDTAEAVLATVCRSGGFEKGLDVFEAAFDEILRIIDTVSVKSKRGQLGDRFRQLGDTFDPLIPYTTMLQELTQHVDASQPAYRSHIEGQAHQPTIVTEVQWRDWGARGTGSNKSLSRSDAAFKIIMKIRTNLEKLESEAKSRAEAKALLEPSR